MNKQEWMDAIFKKVKVEFLEGSSRLRTELLTFAINEKGMVEGYYVPSLKLGIVYDKPIAKDPNVKFVKSK